MRRNFSRLWAKVYQIWQQCVRPSLFIFCLSGARCIPPFTLVIAMSSYKPIRKLEPCADAILSAAARRLIWVGGGGARLRADRV